MPLPIVKQVNDLVWYLQRRREQRWLSRSVGRWERTRTKGRSRFVWRYAFGWGLSMSLFLACWYYFTDGFFSPFVTLLDHSDPVTGALVTFTARSFSTTAYTRNGRATATVPCGVPNMWIEFEYDGRRNGAPIVRGLKCQRCHFEAGPIDLGAVGVQYLNVRCG